MTVVGAADPLTVEAFVRECVVPTLRPGQRLVLENVRIHQSAERCRLVAAAGCQVRFLPASSPDLTPIEEACSKCKTVLRRAKARTVAAVETAIGAALDAISPQDAGHYFAHCGYGIAI